MKNMLTQSRLLQLLDYHPLTGQFTRRFNADSPAWINTRFSGQIAGCVNKNGYVAIRVSGRNYTGHRLAWLYIYGEMPQQIDHINRNRSDNRIANLRKCTAQQSNQNRTSQKTWKGVHCRPGGKLWQAYIGIFRDGKTRTKSLGNYKSAREAAEAYNRAAIDHYGEFACLNDLSLSLSA